MIEFQESCNQFGCGPGCPLPFYFPKANYVAPRMGSSLRLVIAEAPGETENAERVPLVGTAGKWAQSMYRQAGVRWDELTLFNVLPVQPPQNVFPTDALARSYISESDALKVIDHAIEFHLKPLLASRPWERVDLLGDKALEALTGLKGIFTWRGSPLTLKGETVPRAIPTLHPAYIARDQSMIPVVINDLKKSLVVPPEHYDWAPSLDKVQAFTATEFAFDIETNPATQEIKMVGIASRPFETLVLPWTGPYIKELRRIFGAASRVIGQNLIQFDLPILANNTIHIPNDCHVADIMLMQHLLCPDLPHDLEFIASQFTNKPAWKSLDRDKDYYWQLRCARDVDATLQAYRVLAPSLRMEKLDDLYNLVQVPLARICRLMHETGFKRDPKRLVEVREKLLLEIREGEEHLPEELRTRMVPVRKRQKAPAGTLGKGGKPVKYIHVDAQEEVVPWRSGDVLEHYLYGALKLPVQLHVKTKKPTTDKCLDPEARILTADLQWVPVKNIAVGDLLIAFDEANGGRSGRKFRIATVEAKSELKEPKYRIVTDKGELICSQGHGFLRKRRFNNGYCTNHVWAEAKDLTEGDQLAFFLVPWEADRTYEGGWLSGMLDGEGCISRYHCSFAQKPGIVLDRLKAYLALKGYNFSARLRKSGVEEVAVTGENFPGLRLFGSVQPSRFIQKCVRFLEGRRVWGKRSENATVLSVEQLADTNCVGIQTSTKTIIAEGFLTHNTALEKLERKCRREGKMAEAALLGTLRNLRKASTLVSSFCQEQSEGVSRVHAHFNVHGTASGRLSSSDPNLQNQPETARYIYVPSHADWQLVQLDYSSGENRLTAWAAGDTERQARLAQPGFNEHKWNASQMFGIPIEDVVKDNSKDAPYGKAKRIGHGLNYGMGVQKICNTFDLDFAETKQNVLAWKQINSKTIEWQERTARQAESEGYLQTPFGRKRWFYTASLYTESLSFVPQSTLADVIFRAMIALMYERIGWPLEKVMRIARVAAPLPEPARLLVQVHDSLVFECPRNLTDRVIETVKPVMEQPWPELGGMSIPVEVEVAPPNASWGECKPYKPAALAA